ncbi:hypothetical protein Fot_24468 [Forsythia ovata]|uniref:Uncharacterized protein n=1 Tax=Forsythia ovata TaxID=205694 RepID=A0ABD1U699_9LAMI
MNARGRKPSKVGNKTNQHARVKPSRKVPPTMRLSLSQRDASTARQLDDELSFEPRLPWMYTLISLSNRLKSWIQVYVPIKVVVLNEYASKPWDFFTALYRCFIVEEVLRQIFDEVVDCGTSVAVLAKVI